MPKQIIKAGFFEPGLIGAGNFARFRPYQKTEFCLLAAEAGISKWAVAEMMGVNESDVQTAMDQRHQHNPFKKVRMSAEPVEASAPVRGVCNKLTLLSYIDAASGATVTSSLGNLSRSTGMRRTTLEGVLRRLVETGQIEILRKGAKGNPSTYRLTEKGRNALPLKA